MSTGQLVGRSRKVRPSTSSYDNSRLLQYSSKHPERESQLPRGVHMVDIRPGLAKYD
jgi:hypothetical protein